MVKFDENCGNCFYYLPKGVQQWCWRFDTETLSISYCNSKYFKVRDENNIKELNFSPQIIGYLERKKDFDKNENLKLLISGGFVIFGTIVGVVVGFMLK